VTLPISRYDIADYLALSVETVSRALTGLKRSGVIALAGPRQLRIVDRGAIEIEDEYSPLSVA
jgi:CRP/FNR family nitrogen fixation transcriptional regulator